MKIGQVVDARALALIPVYLTAYFDLAAAQTPLAAVGASAAPTGFDT